MGSWRKEEKGGEQGEGSMKWKGKERTGELERKALATYQGWGMPSFHPCPGTDKLCPPQDSVSPSAKWLVKGHFQLREPWWLGEKREES